ncbi:MAG: hypothetical protein R3C31_11345 [Hyphomonadaceae bacterium]
MKRGIYRFQKDGADWARVELSRGLWTDVSKSDYDAEEIEPTFWALQEEESWRRSATQSCGD